MTMTWKSSAPPDRGPDGADTESVVAAQFDGTNDSSGSNLLQEFAKIAASAARPETVSWLARHGIGRDVIFGPHCSVIGVQRIEIDGKYYQPVRDDRPAIVIPISYDFAPACLDPLDLISFEPARPDRWYFRTGDGDVLGEKAIDRAIALEEPLELSHSPLAWLHNSLVGAVIIYWNACLSLYLGNVRRIIADSPALAWNVSSRLDLERCRPMPEIRIRSMADAA